MFCLQLKPQYTHAVRAEAMVSELVRVAFWVVSSASLWSAIPWCSHWDVPNCWDHPWLFRGEEFECQKSSQYQIHDLEIHEATSSNTILPLQNHRKSPCRPQTLPRFKLYIGSELVPGMGGYILRTGSSTWEGVAALFAGACLTFYELNTQVFQSPPQVSWLIMIYRRNAVAVEDFGMPDAVWVLAQSIIIW